MSATRELDLENHAEILLIHFNNPNKVSTVFYGMLVTIQMS